MPLKVLLKASRGETKTDWLESYHCFSFADFEDPARNNFGPLRVLNDDIIQPSKGFDMHSHANFEIVSIVLEGSLEHKDSEGNVEIIPEGAVQRTTAGSGITHSEYNPSDTKPVHFLQIWIEPRKPNLNPSYGWRSYTYETNQIKEVIGNSADTLEIQQNATISLCNLMDKAKYKLKNKKSSVYLYVIKGSIVTLETKLIQGDSAEITNEQEFSMRAKQKSQVLFIEVKA